MPQFKTTRMVQFSETDLAGIVHFANFYRYMEEAEHAFFRSRGLSIHGLQPDGTVVGWPRASAQCTFEAPARFEDVLEIRVDVVRRTRRTLTARYEIWRDATRVAVGEMRTVCCRVSREGGLEAVEIPAVVIERLPVTVEISGSGESGESTKETG